MNLSRPIRLVDFLVFVTSSWHLKGLKLVGLFKVKNMNKNKQKQTFTSKNWGPDINLKLYLAQGRKVR